MITVKSVSKIRHNYSPKIPILDHPEVSTVWSEVHMDYWHIDLWHMDLWYMDLWHIDFWYMDLWHIDLWHIDLWHIDPWHIMLHVSLQYFTCISSVFYMYLFRILHVALQFIYMCLFSILHVPHQVILHVFSSSFSIHVIQQTIFYSRSQ